MTPINIKLLKSIASEIEEMEARLKTFKGDKKPFERRVAVFKQLALEYRSLCVDLHLQDMENEKMELAIISKVREVQVKEEDLKYREKQLEEFGGTMSDEQLQTFIKSYLDSKK